MKRVQVSKINHHSESGATFVVDLEIALLDADKNNRLTKTNHITTEN